MMAPVKKGRKTFLWPAVVAVLAAGGQCGDANVVCRELAGSE